MKRFLSFICIAIMLQCAYPQENHFDDYLPLTSSGSIPSDFTMLTYEKYLKDKILTDTIKNKRERKTHNQFVLSSNFYISQMLSSGKVIFGDPVSQYISSVADTLLKDFPELRAQLRFYTIKSPYVNAFSTDQGIIFVNLGLIAQLENESQLAYVLAHEIVHYVKKHNLERFILSEKVDKKNNILNPIDYEERQFVLNYRSKEAEKEADREGLTTYYTSSAYSFEGVTAMYDVLLYSYLPFDDEPFDLGIFEKELFHFPSDYIIDTIGAIDAEKYFKDDSGDHPSIENRLSEVEELLKNLDNSGRKDFLHPAGDFYHIRNLARFECVRLKIIRREYYNAIYDIFLLMKEFPKSKYLQVCMSACLYSLSIYKTSGESTAQKSYKNIQGESQKVYFFFHKLPKKDLNVIALAYCWKTKNLYPDNIFLQQACKDLFETMTGEHEFQFDYFKPLPVAVASPDTLQKAAETDTVQKSKYDKIKNKTKNSPKSDDYYLRFAFADLLDDTAFVNTFIAGIKKHKEDLAYENTDDFGNPFSRGKTKNHTRRGKEKCKNNCIQNVLLADPYFVQYDSRKNDEIYYNSTESKRLLINDMILNNAARANLKVEIIDPGFFNEKDISALNHLSFINEWLSERFSNSSVSLAPFEGEHMQPIMKTYGTKYLSWMSIISVRVRKEGSRLSYIYLCLTPYTLPVGLTMLISPRYYSYYFQVMYNTENGEPVSWQRALSETKFRRDMLNSKIFDSFYQIKRKKAE